MRASVPLIDIVIPFFNAAEALEESVRSVQDQTVRAWRMQLVDDGSRDDGADLARRIATDDARIAFVQQANAGPSAARNRGSAEGAAPFIAFLDADDLWEPHHLSQALAVLRADRSLGVAFAPARYLWPGATAPRGGSRPWTRDLRFEDLLAGNPTTTCSSLVFRREVLERVGGLDETMRHAEDQEWLLRVLHAGFGVRSGRAATVRYRIRSGGLSSEIRDMDAGWRRVLATAERLAPERTRAAARRAWAMRKLHQARRRYQDGRWGAAMLMDLAQSLAIAPHDALRSVAARDPSPKRGLGAPVGPRLGTGLSTAPRVSVVIPLYGAERYVDAALQSAQRQTFRDLEILVVDDGSCDRGPEIVRRRADEDPRIRLIRQENRGLAGARNTGLRHARGAYVALLDADDVWREDKLARHVAHLDQNPAVGVSYAASRLIDEAGDRLPVVQRPRLRDVDLDTVFCRNPVGNGSAAVIRRAALDAVVFETLASEGLRRCWFDEDLRQSEDVEFWTRMAATTRWRFEGIVGELTFYRVNPAGLSANVARQYATWLRVRRRVARYAPALIARAGERARAYQLRYFARRALADADARGALALMRRAVRAYPGMVAEEPAKSLSTLGAALAIALWRGVPPAFAALTCRGL